MKVGGLRLISVPPALAYGDRGKKPFIPPNATVDFAIQLLSCKRSGTCHRVAVRTSCSLTGCRPFFADCCRYESQYLAGLEDFRVLATARSLFADEYGQLTLL